MALSNSLLKSFAEVTNDVSASEGSYAYGTVVVSGNKKFVMLDGSSTLTSISIATDVENGDRIMVYLSDHTASVVGNITCPSSGRLSSVLSNADFDYDHLSVEELDAVTANINYIFSQYISTGTLVSDNVLTEYLQAQYAQITDLEAAYAEIGIIKADYATIEYLEGTYATFQDLESASLTANEAILGYVEANFAQIDLLNVSVGSVANLFADVGVLTSVTIEDGYITGMLNGVRINADVITAGTLAVDRLLVTGPDSIVYELNVESSGLSLSELEEEQYEYYLNGTDIIANSITANQIAVGTITSNELAAGAVIADKIDVDSLSAITMNLGTMKYSGYLTTNEERKTYDDFEHKGMTLDQNGIGAYFSDTQYWTMSVVGELVAMEGLIGAFSLDNNAIYTKQDVFQTMSDNIYLGKDGLSLGTDFSVNPEGYLRATFGEIGGFNIGTNSFYTEENAFNKIDKNIYLGKDGLSLGTSFSVTSSGKLTASSGEIGGWSITSNKIYGGVEGNVTAVMAAPTSDTSYVFATGGSTHTDYSDCTFRVRADGTTFLSKALHIIESYDEYVGGNAAVIQFDVSAGSYRNAYIYEHDDNLYLWSKVSTGSDGNTGQVHCKSPFYVDNAHTIHAGGNIYTDNYFRMSTNATYLQGMDTKGDYRSIAGIDSSNYFKFATGSISNRVYVGTEDYTSYIYLRANTRINMTSPVTISGKVSVSGSIEADGNIQADDGNIVTTGGYLRLENGYTLQIRDVDGSYRQAVNLDSSNHYIFGGGATATVNNCYIGTNDYTKSIYLRCAASANVHIGSNSIGSGTKPIYLSSGILTASSSTVGGSAKPVYLNSGTLTAVSSINLKVAAADGTNYYSVGSTSTEAQYVFYLNSKVSGSTYQLGVHGAFGTSGNNKGYTFNSTTSDIRLKNNIVSTSVEAMPLLRQIKIREFDRIDTGYHQKIGFVADELEELDDSLSLGGGYDENGDMNVKTVNDFYLLGYMVKGMQEMDTDLLTVESHIESDESRISSLQDQLVAAQTRISELESEVRLLKVS